MYFSGNGLCKEVCMSCFLNIEALLQWRLGSPQFEPKVVRQIFPVLIFLVEIGTYHMPLALR